jgi:hypothetical protein
VKCISTNEILGFKASACAGRCDWPSAWKLLEAGPSWDTRVIFGVAAAGSHFDHFDATVERSEVVNCEEAQAAIIKLKVWLSTSVCLVKVEAVRAVICTGSMSRVHILIY